MIKKDSFLRTQISGLRAPKSISDACALALSLAVLLVLLLHPLAAFCQDKVVGQMSETLVNMPYVHISRHVPQSHPKGVVLLIHGITQHADTLSVIASNLVADDYIAYGIDLRGHGWWHFGQQKGAVGYRSDYRGSVNDVCNLAAQLRQTYGRLPIYVIGESVGAAVALQAAVRDPIDVNGLILCGAGSKVCSAKLTWLIPDLLKGLVGRQVNIVRYQMRYGSDDIPALVETIADPQQRKYLGQCELFQARNFVSKNEKFAKKLNPNIPVIVIQGEEDHTLKAKSAEKVFADISGDDKKFIDVPNCGHILLGMNRLKPMVVDSIVRFVDDNSAEQFSYLPGRAL